MNASLIPSFKESIFQNVVDIAVDLSEVGLDSCLESGIIKDIPFVNILYKLGNIAISIRERHFLQKTLLFIQEINNGTVSDEDRDHHKKELESNPQKMEKELGYILVSIDRYLQNIKSKILARFYAAYLDSSNKYDWVDFCVLSEILDEVSIYDFDTLFYIYKNGQVRMCNSIEGISFFQISRLEKCGIIHEDILTRNNGSCVKCFSLSPQGKIFCELCKIEDFIETRE